MCTMSSRQYYCSGGESRVPAPSLGDVGYCSAKKQHVFRSRSKKELIVVTCQFNCCTNKELLLKIHLLGQLSEVTGSRRVKIQPQSEKKILE